MPLRLALLAPAIAALTLLALPGPASAAPCSKTFTDSAGFTWKFDDDGSLLDGGKGGPPDPYGSSITTRFALLEGLKSGNNLLSPAEYTNPNTTACALTQGGREVAYPEHTLGSKVPGIAARRRVYVPASGRAFARWIDTFHNASSSTRSVDMILSGGLGSDCGTKIGDDSTGNHYADRHDRWATTYDDAAGDNSCPNLLEPNP